MELRAAAIAASLIDYRGKRPLIGDAIAMTLARYGSPALLFAREHRIRIVPLRRGERYAEASPALIRLDVRVDRWPSPPAGLFVVEERSIFLRSRSPMTVAHEFGHALDCALGGGIYRSGLDPRIRSFFASAREFITPYAATGLDEYFAESLRAFVEANDPTSLWPRATRDRLWRIDRQMFFYVEHIFRTEFTTLKVAA